MSLYHLNTSVGSRAGGQSASAKDDYIEREGRYEGDASELEHSESGHMPGWAEEDPHAYWEAADAHERANGRLFREVEFALPTELSGSERLEAAREFAHFLTDRERLPYTLAIHRGGGENPHCHLVISERSNDGLERTAETWFKRYNGKAPERGGARKISTSSKGVAPEHAGSLGRACEPCPGPSRKHGADRPPESVRSGGGSEGGGRPGAGRGAEPGAGETPGARGRDRGEVPAGRGGESVVSAGGGRGDRGAQRQWASRWESMNRELSRVQEELGQMLEDLRGVERAIREMAKKIADRARRVFDRRQTGELVRGAFRPSQKPQPERGGARGELPEKPRDRNMCR